MRLIIGLDHVQLSMPAGGEEAARAFYGGLLGLEEAPKPGPLAVRGGCWFAGDGVAIHLGVEDGFVPARKAHAALLVGDLDGLRARLEAAGVRVRDDDVEIGVRRWYADDPFGNRLELVDARDGGFTTGRATFCHEALVELEPGSEPAALGGAITVELCGQWEHDGACRVPHGTVVLEHEADRVRIRTVFAARPGEEPGVRRRIHEVLAGGSLEAAGRSAAWRLVEDSAAPVPEADEGFAARQR